MARVEDEREERELEMGAGGRRATEVGWKRWVGVVRKGHSGARKAVKGALERYTQSRPDSSIRKLAGLCWSITGGLLAGQTLVFAKSAVKVGFFWGVPSSARLGS